MSTPHILTTSLAEIRSFNPCADGWRNILNARKPACDADYQTQFPLVDCLQSNSVSDVCWLLGKRKKEIQICVKFARMCADSVKHLNTAYSRKAAYTAAAATDAAAYADAAADAAAAAAYAAADAAYAYNKQKELNKQFLIQCINEFTRSN
jgi:hypothetical protein